MNLQKALDRFNSGQFVGEDMVVIDAAARRLLEGTDIEICEIHKAAADPNFDGIVNNEPCVHYESDAMNCRIVVRRLVEWEDTE